MSDEMNVSPFGLAGLKVEGAPMHPEELSWEHYPDEGCAICLQRWNNQLKAYNKYHGIEETGSN